MNSSALKKLSTISQRLRNSDRARTQARHLYRLMVQGAASNADHLHAGADRAAFVGPALARPVSRGPARGRRRSRYGARQEDGAAAPTAARRAARNEARK